jgi:hypothetical protein
MAKRSRPTDQPAKGSGTADDARDARKRLKQLEKELGELQATEAKRREQLNEVRASAADVRTRLAAQWAIITELTGSGPVAAEGPIGFCMREKRPVQISDPRPVTLSNGRAALAGTCPVCGARVIVLSSRSAATSA